MNEITATVADAKADPEPKTAHAGNPQTETGIPDLAQARTGTVSRKGVFAAAFAALSLIAVGAVSIHRALPGGGAAGEGSKRTADKPSAAAAEPHKLDMTLPVPAKAASAAPMASGRQIPAIAPIPEDARAEPIPLRRTDPSRIAPEDAPAVLLSTRVNNAAPIGTGPSRQVAGVVPADGPDASDPLESTRRNLDAYQRRLQGLLDTLTKKAETAAGEGTSTMPAGGMGGVLAAHATSPATSPGSLFGGQLPSSATPRVIAHSLGNRNLTLPKGTAFTCALKTRLVSATSGFVSCQVQRNVFSENGRVLLIERGSHIDGEYRSTAVRPGTIRIPVLWTRIRTPNAVTVDIDSPGTGQLGESGVDGYVDNRWLERIGAAMLLSLIDDAVKLTLANETQADGSTVVLQSTTSTTSKLAEKVLDSTINIPPVIYQNQGALVGIYVARDVDFSSVYELKASAR
jgi:type IV secretion system protein VirB10